MSDVQPKVRVQMPIRFLPPQDLITRYANNLVVQNADEVFVLSFYEAELPLVVGSEEEQTAQINKLDSVDAKCVARIVVTPKRMEDFVRVLQANLNRYRAASPDRDNEGGK